MKSMKAILCFALLAMMTKSSDAGIIASFTSDGSAFVPSAINIGQTTNVPLYLRFDGSGTNYLNSPGLLSAGVGISFAPTGIVDASVLSLGIGWDSMLSAVTLDNSVGFAALQTSVGFFDPAVTDGGTNSILLGTLQFTGVSAGTSILTLADADTGFDDTVIDGFIDISMDGVIDDEITFGVVASITVNGTAAVPEPASGVALLLGVGYWGWRSRRRILSVRNSREI